MEKYLFQGGRRSIGEQTTESFTRCMMNLFVGGKFKVPNGFFHLAKAISLSETSKLSRGKDWQFLPNRSQLKRVAARFILNQAKFPLWYFAALKNWKKNQTDGRTDFNRAWSRRRFVCLPKTSLFRVAWLVTGEMSWVLSIRIKSHWDTFGLHVILINVKWDTIQIS